MELVTAWADGKAFMLRLLKTYSEKPNRWFFRGLQAHKSMIHLNNGEKNV